MTLFDYVHQHPVWTCVWAGLGLVFIVVLAESAAQVIVAWRRR